LKVVEELEEHLHRDKAIRTGLMGSTDTSNSQLIGQSRKSAIEGEQVDEGLDIEEFGEVEADELVEVVALRGEVVVHEDA
jgi:hypothetical protein